MSGIKTITYRHFFLIILVSFCYGADSTAAAGSDIKKDKAAVTKTDKRKPVKKKPAGKAANSPVGDAKVAAEEKKAAGGDRTADQPLAEIRHIAETGAPNLALHLLNETQLKLTNDQAQWLALERLRIQIYQQNRNWQGLLDRISSLPTGLPNEFMYQAKTVQAEAWLELGQGTTARKHLNQMILSVAGQDDDATVLWLKRWRKLIVMCYLSARQVDDARTAIQRYQQDYTAKDAATLILRARILLMNDQAQDSVELLASHTDKPEADMLYLLARLRAGILTPVEAVKIGLQQITTHGADERLGYSLWAVVAEASQRAGDRTTAVNALEHVVAYRQRKSVDTLFDFNIDSLWNAYIDFALYQGNKAQFLIGQDEKWFAAAKKYFRKKPLIARAYYALLMHRAQGEESRVAAADMLVKSLKRRKHGGEILRQLFVRSKYFPAISDVPEPARRTLVDVALAQNDIPLASEIMATLVTPPKDNTGYMWYLRRARILVLGGQAQRGADALNEFITGKGDKLSKEQVERLLQVVFDLQTVGAHDAAIQLFQRVSTLTDDEKIRRELFYWMADSRRAQNRYPEAAHLYLKSAMLPDGKGLDPWGQTARYQAAECLGQAGLIEDAHELFQHLLRVTREADRRAVLEHEIHKLRLSRVRENKAATEEIVEQGVE